MRLKLDDGAIHRILACEILIFVSIFESKKQCMQLDASVSPDIIVKYYLFFYNIASNQQEETFSRI
jgi:hypothetical protein